MTAYEFITAQISLADKLIESLDVKGYHTMLENLPFVATAFNAATATKAVLADLLSDVDESTSFEDAIAFVRDLAKEYGKNEDIERTALVDLEDQFKKMAYPD